MDILPLLCTVAVAFTGLTEAAGVLPDTPLNAAVGDKVMFTTTLSPTVTPFLIVDWRFGDKNIIYFNVDNITGPEYEGRVTLFMSTGSLELRDLTPEDSGEYRVSIISVGARPIEGNTRLDVLVPVSDVMVTASSTDLVEFNSSVHLSCSSSGSSPSFLWLNGSSEVTASDRVQLTDGGANLTIINVTRYDQGPFTCQVSNLVSNGTSAPKNLFINYGPENITLTISSSKEIYAEGSDITLSCSANSKPAAQFMWLLNGDLLSDTGPELRLMKIQESQSGNYSCQAFNSKTLRYEMSQPAAISVLGKISKVSITETNSPIEGNSFNLTCDAAGSVFTREWMKGGLNLTPDDNVTLYDNNRVLSFKSLSKKDNGDYVCKVSNTFSQDEAKYTMVVSFGPENVQINGPSEILWGDTLTLTCSAESVPATYTWILKGTEIHDSSVLTKKNTKPSDNGNYTCQVMNHITGRKSSATHGLSVTGEQPPSTCSAGCIAGIVIAVLVLLSVTAGGGYYIYDMKKKKGKLSNINTATGTGAEGQDNKAYAGRQELNYADITIFQKRDGGTVQLGVQGSTSDYSQIRVNNNPSAASSPPTYDAHLQRQKKPAPQPDSDGAQVYAKVRKN